MSKKYSRDRFLSNDYKAHFHELEKVEENLGNVTKEIIRLKLERENTIMNINSLSFSLNEISKWEHLHKFTRVFYTVTTLLGITAIPVCFMLPVVSIVKYVFATVFVLSLMASVVARGLENDSKDLDKYKKMNRMEKKKYQEELVDSISKKKKRKFALEGEIIIQKNLQESYREAYSDIKKQTNSKKKKRKFALEREMTIQKNLQESYRDAYSGIKKQTGNLFSDYIGEVDYSQVHLQANDQESLSLNKTLCKKL